MHQEVLAVRREVHIKMFLLLQFSDRDDGMLYLTNYERDHDRQTRGELVENIASAMLLDLRTVRSDESEMLHLFGERLQRVVRRIARRHDVV